MWFAVRSPSLCEGDPRSIAVQANLYPTRPIFIPQGQSLSHKANLYPTRIGRTVGGARSRADMAPGAATRIGRTVGGLPLVPIRLARPGDIRPISIDRIMRWRIPPHLTLAVPGEVGFCGRAAVATAESRPPSHVALRPSPSRPRGADRLPGHAVPAVGDPPGARRSGRHRARAARVGRDARGVPHPDGPRSALRGAVFPFPVQCLLGRSWRRRLVEPAGRGDHRRATAAYPGADLPRPGAGRSSSAFRSAASRRSGPTACSTGLPASSRFRRSRCPRSSSRSIPCSSSRFF